MNASGMINLYTVINRNEELLINQMNSSGMMKIYTGIYHSEEIMTIYQSPNFNFYYQMLYLKIFHNSGCWSEIVT